MNRMSDTDQQASDAPAETLIAVFSNNNGRAWPKHDQGMKAKYMSAGEALTKHFPYDAHGAAYSVQTTPRRLAGGAITQLRLLGQAGVPMDKFIGDADGPCHGVPKEAWTSEHVERQDAWWADEQIKLAALEAVHPGAFVYRTKGGYRIVFRLARSFVLEQPDDGKAWTVRYFRTICYLARRFNIVLDAQCADWTRLFRLPFVTRDDEVQTPETMGDASNLGALVFEPSNDDVPADVAVARRISTSEPNWLRIYRRLAPPEPIAPQVASNVVPIRKGVARPGKPSLDERRRAYVDAALRASCDELAGKGPSSGRNGALNDKAFALGRYVGGGTIGRAEVEGALTDAARRCGLVRDDGLDAVQATLASGLDAGIRSPRTPEITEEDIPFVEGPAAESEPAPVGPANDETAPASQSPFEIGAWLSARVDVNGDDARPFIEIVNDMHEVVLHTTEALAADPRINLYRRDGSLVKLVRSSSTNDGRRDAGLPICRCVQPAALLEYLTLTARFVKYDGRVKDLVPCLPTAQLISGVFQRGEWPGMRSLVGVIETPFLRADGTVAQVPGYDEKTGYVLCPHEPFDMVADAPTQADAKAALASLADLFCDFPFARADEQKTWRTHDLSKDIDKAVALAAILTLIARPAIGAGNTPAFLFSANNRGTGKTLIADVVCIIATGRVAPKTGYPSEQEEMEKTLGSVAIEACSVLSFDNINTRFGGGAIDLTLTCGGSKKFRVLGASEMKQCTWRTVVMATGNNMNVRDDTGRRALICKQDTDWERPETRDSAAFKYPRLLAHVAEHRRELVAQALTILRAHAVAGHPSAGVKPLGSFEEWSKYVASAIVWAGGADPTLALAESEAGDDPAKAALTTLFENWHRLCPADGGGIKAGEALAKLYPSRKAGEPPLDDSLNDLREVVDLLCQKRGAHIEARQFGEMLRKYKNRVIGSLRLTARSAMGGVNRWAVVQTKQTSDRGSSSQEGQKPTDRGELPKFFSDVDGHTSEKKNGSLYGGAGIAPSVTSDPLTPDPGATQPARPNRVSL